MLLLEEIFLVQPLKTKHSFHEEQQEQPEQEQEQQEQETETDDGPKDILN